MSSTTPRTRSALQPGERLQAAQPDQPARRTWLVALALASAGGLSFPVRAQSAVDPASVPEPKRTRQQRYLTAAEVPAFIQAQGGPSRVLFLDLRTRAEATETGYKLNGTKAFISGGGGLLSTAGDYLRFAQMLADKGRFEGRQYLSPVTVELMTSQQVPDTAMGKAYGDTRVKPGEGPQVPGLDRAPAQPAGRGLDSEWKP